MCTAARRHQPFHAHSGTPVHASAPPSHDFSVHAAQAAPVGLKPHGTAQCATAQSWNLSQHSEHATEKASALRTHDEVHVPPCVPQDVRQPDTSSYKCASLSLRV
jgi:hypothetical protein